MSKRTYSNEDTLASAGTSQRLDSAGGTSTFDESVDQIMVTSSHDAFIAKTSSEINTQGSGGRDDRAYIEANKPTVLPWSGSDIFFLNANSAETPTVYVTGVAL